METGAGGGAAVEGAGVCRHRLRFAETGRWRGDGRQVGLWRGRGGCVVVVVGGWEVGICCVLVSGMVTYLVVSELRERVRGETVLGGVSVGGQCWHWCWGCCDCVGLA